MADKVARFKELLAKQQAGKITPEELKELMALMKSAPEMQPGYIPPVSTSEAKKAMDQAIRNGATATLALPTGTQAGGPADGKGPSFSDASVATGSTPGYIDIPQSEKDRVAAEDAEAAEVERHAKDYRERPGQIPGADPNSMTTTLGGDQWGVGGVKIAAAGPDYNPASAAPAPAKSAAPAVPALDTGKGQTGGPSLESRDEAHIDTGTSDQSEHPGKVADDLSSPAPTTKTKSPVDWKKIGQQIADVVQGTAYGYTGNRNPTRLETQTATEAQNALVDKQLKYQQMREQSDREFQANLESIRAKLSTDLQTSQNANQVAIAKMQADAAAQQAALNRDTQLKIADKEYGARQAQQLGSGPGYLGKLD